MSFLSVSHSLRASVDGGDGALDTLSKLEIGIDPFWPRLPRSFRAGCASHPAASGASSLELLDLSRYQLSSHEETPRIESFLVVFW